MSDKLNLTKLTKNVIKFAHLEGLPLDRQIEELEKLIPNINGSICTMNAKTKAIDRAIRELKFEKSKQPADVKASLTKQRADTDGLPASYIIDNSYGCSIVLNGMPIKYVTSYFVDCNDSYMLNLKLHLSIPKKWYFGHKSDDACPQLKNTYQLVEKGEACSFIVNGVSIEYFVSDYSIGRDESNFIELGIHLSIPRKEIYLDISTI